MKESGNIDTTEVVAADNNSRLPVLISKNLLKDLLKKWWIFAIVGILAGLGGFFYAMFQKPVYESKLTFALDAGSNEGGLSGAMSLAAQFGFGLGGGQSLFDGDNILEILKSRRMIETVLISVDTFDNRPYTMAEFYLELSGLRKAFSNRPDLAAVKFPAGSARGSLSYLQDSVLNMIHLDLAQNLIFAGRPDKKLSIYELRIQSFNEKFSKDFTDRLLETTNNFYTEITSKKDRETLQILEQRVESLKSNVAGSIESRASTQDANVNPAFAAAQSPLLKQQYNVQAYSEAYKEMFKTLEMARYQYLKKIPLLQIIDYADYPMKKIKMGKLKTGITFAIISVLLSVIVFWLYRIFDRADK